MRESEVTDIEIDRAAAELRLMFADGVRGAIRLDDLRRHCPCATCRALRQRSGSPLADPADASGLEVRDARLVGAWGLGITWGDGHATGIHSFETLHQWLLSGQPVLQPDSGLGG